MKQKLNMDEIRGKKEELKVLLKAEIQRELDRDPEVFELLKEFKEELKLMCDEKIPRTRQLHILKKTFGWAPNYQNLKAFYDKYGCGAADLLDEPENDEKV